MSHIILPPLVVQCDRGGWYGSGIEQAQMNLHEWNEKKCPKMFLPRGQITSNKCAPSVLQQRGDRKQENEVFAQRQTWLGTGGGESEIGEGEVLNDDN